MNTPSTTTSIPGAKQRASSRRRTATVVGGIATVASLALLAGPAAAVAEQAPAVPEQAPAVAKQATAVAKEREPSLTGSGRVHYNYAPDDDIRFAFNARGNTIGASGTFRISHEIDGVQYWSVADVNCLVTGGNVATVTGIVTSTNAPGWQGLQVGLTVEDRGRRDRVGFSWVVSEPPTPRCLGTAPFTEVIDGDYVVRDGPFLVPGYPPPGSEKGGGKESRPQWPGKGTGFGTGS